MLTWEYPPDVIGGLGRAVGALATELARESHDVCVVTRGSATASDERIDGVRVVRAALDPIAIDFTTETLLAWSQAAEHALLRAALPVLRDWTPDVVHAHDWLVAQSAITLHQHTGAKLIVTLHATEAGRHRGWLPEPLNRGIHSVERWLATSADEVITCSASMREEADRLFAPPADRVHVVPNGIDAPAWRVAPRARRAARARWAGDTGDAPIVVFAGRLVHEKGVQTVIDALPALRRRHPGLRLLVAGTGGHEPQLRELARQRRVARAVQWCGFVPDAELPGLLAAADVCVVPSLYEPFGIVALEAAAAGSPLVVAGTGGLRDLAAAGVASGCFTADDPASLTDAVDALLADPEAAQRSARRAARIVARDYSWGAVAARTAEVYAG